MPRAAAAAISPFRRGAVTSLPLPSWRPRCGCGRLPARSSPGSRPSSCPAGWGATDPRPWPLFCGSSPAAAADRWVTVTGTFDVITDWGADAAPPPMGGLALALQWGPLAHAIHAPISEIDSSEEEAEP
ncbi:uncharacterized protein LOC141939007 isoform X2 [Strix uralensis]|uniref:uncharacterized protein LOC141939007 isoform X2 n=1 Tax=Strix uralensis TaxID=36305 RepID=UPI003DA6724A